MSPYRRKVSVSLEVHDRVVPIGIVVVPILDDRLRLVGRELFAPLLSEAIALFVRGQGGGAEVEPMAPRRPIEVLAVAADEARTVVRIVPLVVAKEVNETVVHVPC